MPSPHQNSLMDNARIKLPGALDGVLTMEFYLVLDEFFRSTNIWEEDIPFDVTATSLSRAANPEAFTYEILPAESGTILRLIGLRDMDGIPQHGDMAIPGTIVLAHSPNVDTTYIATVSKTVTEPTTRQGYPVYPEWVLIRYFSDILDGLLGRMMMQSAKPYSSPQMGQYHLRRFGAAVSRAGSEAGRKNLWGAQAWRFPQSFTNRRNNRI